MNNWTRLFDQGDASAGAARDRSAIPEHHYFAFLSYSHHDSADADWLHQELERFRVPRSLAGKLTANGVIPKRLSPVFRDRHELAASDDLGAEIRQALELSRCLIVLCSPAAAKSKWTNAEIDTFKRLHPEGCIIAAVLSGEPLASGIPGREDEECFPPALVAKYNRRGKPTGQKTEPLAADLREGKGGRRLGFLKIVAGILGVGLDDLVQRDELRRQRRLGLIAAASLAGMVITSGLAVTAIHARDAARYQRRQAESLIEFMVGDLREKLQPVGQLAALDGVGSRVLDYYSKQDTSELSDAALLQRSRALSLMADVAYQRGKLQEAQALYGQAMAGTAEELRRSPDDPERLFEHAQNVFWVAEVARHRGYPNQAAAGYQQYRRLGYRLAALEPDNLKYRMEAFYGDEDVGISLYNQRRYAEADSQFVRSLAPMQGLAALYPANVTYQNEVGKLFSWVAQAEWAQGHYDRAIAARERQLALLATAIRNVGTNVDLQWQAAIAHMSLGIIYQERNQPDRAAAELRAAATEADRLVLLEPTNAQSKNTAALAWLNLVRPLLALGSVKDATDAAHKGCALVAGLSASGSGMTRVGMAKTDCSMMRARVALAGAATADALSAAQQALASAREERNEDPLMDRYRIAAAYLLLGDVRQRSGDTTAAAAAWNGALAQLPKGAAERPSETNERAQLLLRLGREQDARPLTERLQKLGYRNTT